MEASHDLTADATVVGKAGLSTVSALDLDKVHAVRSTIQVVLGSGSGPYDLLDGLLNRRPVKGVCILPFFKRLHSTYGRVV